MSLPNKLKLMHLHQDGHSYLGQVNEVTRPKLAIKAESYRAGDMLGEVDINLGLEKLEAELKFGGHMADMRALFGSAEISGVLLRLSQSYERDDTGEVNAVELVMRGRYTEIDPGNAKVGDDTEETYKASLTYYKEIVNGKTLIEIDLLNHVFVVNGVDRLKEHRRAIGL